MTERVIRLDKKDVWVGKTKDYKYSPKDKNRNTAIEAILPCTLETLNQHGIKIKPSQNAELIDTKVISKIINDKKLSDRAAQAAHDILHLLLIWESCTSKKEVNYIYSDCGNGGRKRREPIENIPEWAMDEYNNVFKPWLKEAGEYKVGSQRAKYKLSYVEITLAIIEYNVRPSALKRITHTRYDRILTALEKSLCIYANNKKISSNHSK